MNFNIQSFSGVITNSSTEVFAVFDKRNIKSIKDLVNSIIKIGDPVLDFDDLFEFKFNINAFAVEDLFEYRQDCAVLKDKEFKDEEELYQFLESLPLDELFKVQEFYDEDAWDSCTRFFEGITIIAKTDSHQVHKAAALLSSLHEIFDLESCYC